MYLCRRESCGYICVSAHVCVCYVPLTLGHLGLKVHVSELLHSEVIQLIVWRHNETLELHVFFDLGQLAPNCCALLVQSVVRRSQSHRPIPGEACRCLAHPHATHADQGQGQASQSPKQLGVCHVAAEGSGALVVGGDWTSLAGCHPETTVHSSRSLCYNAGRMLRFISRRHFYADSVEVSVKRFKEVHSD